MAAPLVPAAAVARVPPVRVDHPVVAEAEAEAAEAAGVAEEEEEEEGAGDDLSEANSNLAQNENR